MKSTILLDFFNQFFGNNIIELSFDEKSTVEYVLLQL